MVSQRVVVPAGRELSHLVIKLARDRVERLEHPPGARLPRARGAHPVLRQLRPPKISGPAGEPAPGQGTDQIPDRQHEMVDRPGSVHAAVRMDQLGQTRQQITHQVRAGQPGQRELRRGAVAEHAPDALRIFSYCGGHQIPPRVAGEFPGEPGVGLAFGRRLGEQPVGYPGLLVGLTVDPGRVQPPKIFFRGQNAGMAKQVPQHQQRVGLGQVERQSRVGAGGGHQPGGLPVMTADQVFQGLHGHGMAQAVRVDMGEPGLEAGPDPIRGALEH